MSCQRSQSTSLPIAGKDREEFVEDLFGEGERVFTLDDLAESLIAAPIRQGESRDEHIRIEDDPHVSRYRRRSSSLRSARSFA